MSVSILVVDDEPNVAELFRLRFRREARQGTYVMHFADSGEVALERLSGNIEPALIAVLSDINVPGHGRLQCSARSTAVPDLPVMMVTPYGDEEGSRRARELGAAQFLSKPIQRVGCGTISQLADRLRPVERTIAPGLCHGAEQDRDN
jgi:CheY-like chemotaxis protein